MLAKGSQPTISEKGVGWLWLSSGTEHEKRKRNTLWTSQSKLLSTLVWPTTVSKIISEYNISNHDFKNISVSHRWISSLKTLNSNAGGYQHIVICVCKTLQCSKLGVVPMKVVLVQEELFGLAVSQSLKPMSRFTRNPSIKAPDTQLSWAAQSQQAIPIQ